MMKKTILIVLAAGVALCAQAPTVLELTQGRPNTGPNTAGKVTESVTGFGSHTVREPMPLEVTLEWFDRSDYREYDPFAFRVSFRNRGRNAVVLPWEPDRDQVIPGPDAPLMQWLLAISLDGAQYDRLTFPIAILYGSAASPGTLQVIPPGAQAEIIAPGRWRFLTDDSKRRAEATLPATVNVRANVAFLSGINGHVYRDLVSASFPIQLDSARNP